MIPLNKIIILCDTYIKHFSYIYLRIAYVDPIYMYKRNFTNIGYIPQDYQSTNSSLFIYFYWISRTL